MKRQEERHTHEDVMCHVYIYTYVAYTYTTYRFISRQDFNIGSLDPLQVVYTPCTYIY